MLYMVSYDLRIQGGDYDALYSAIQNLGPALQCLQSVWIVQSTLSISGVRDSLLRQMSTQDSLIVVDITGKSYDGWLQREYWNWIRVHNF